MCIFLYVQIAMLGSMSTKREKVMSMRESLSTMRGYRRSIRAFLSPMRESTKMRTSSYRECPQQFCFFLNFLYFD